MTKKNYAIFVDFKLLHLFESKPYMATKYYYSLYQIDTAEYNINTKKIFFHFQLGYFWWNFGLRSINMSWHWQLNIFFIFELFRFTSIFVKSVAQLLTNTLMKCLSRSNISSSIPWHHTTFLLLDGRPCIIYIGIF